LFLWVRHHYMAWCWFVTRSHDVQVIPPWQSLVTDSIKKYGLRRILLFKSCLRHILFLFDSRIWPTARFSWKFWLFIILGWIWFQVNHSCQFIGGEHDSNPNTEWSQRHNLFQTIIKKVSNNKPFVKSNLLKYKSHKSNSIPIFFIRNNVRQHLQHNYHNY